MKVSILISFMCLVFVCKNHGQILIDDKSGDPVANFYNNGNGFNNVSLIRLSTGSQSIGFSHLLSNQLINSANYSIHEISLKVKPTDGFGALLANGQFSPGIRIGYSYIKVPFLSGSGPGGYVDWGGISINFDFDKYNLVKKDTPFQHQVYTEKFNSLSVNLFYNALVKSRWILHGRIGFMKANNLDDLTKVQINEIAFRSTEPSSATEREVVKNKTGYSGTYKNYDAFPLILSFTRATATDTPGSTAAMSLKFGYTVFIKNVMSSNLPKTTIGIIGFLTKQDKNGVRTPVFGLSVQAKDPFDTMKKGNNLQDRIGVGFTSIFSL